MSKHISDPSSDCARNMFYL